MYWKMLWFHFDFNPSSSWLHYLKHLDIIMDGTIQKRCNWLLTHSRYTHTTPSIYISFSILFYISVCFNWYVFTYLLAINYSLNLVVKEFPEVAFPWEFLHFCHILAFCTGYFRWYNACKCSPNLVFFIHRGKLMYPTCLIDTGDTGDLFPRLFIFPNE